MRLSVCTAALNRSLFLNISFTYKVNKGGGGAGGVGTQYKRDMLHNALPFVRTAAGTGK